MSTNQTETLTINGQQVTVQISQTETGYRVTGAFAVADGRTIGQALAAWFALVSK